MNIEAKVKQLFIDILGDEIPEITGDSHLHKDLGLDSLDVVDVVMQLEDIFMINIDDIAFDKLSTVQSVIDCVKFYKESPITL